MRRLVIFLPVAALLVLTGCRDVLVDAAPVPQAPPTGGNTATIYLKGPTTLGVNHQGNYRAEYVHGVDHYEWRALGSGAVDIGFPYGDSRLPVLTGEGVGTVDLIAEAYDAAGNLMAVAGKTVTIH